MFIKKQMSLDAHTERSSSHTSSKVAAFWPAKWPPCHKMVTGWASQFEEAGLDKHQEMKTMCPYWFSKAVCDGGDEALADNWNVGGLCAMLESEPPTPALSRTGTGRGLRGSAARKPSFDIHFEA